MKFNSLIPELTVHDLEKTRQFYTGILGFKIEYERSEDKFIFMSLEENQLMFEQENGNWTTGKLEFPYGRGINLEMCVSDVDALYQRVLSFGITPFRTPKENHYRNNEEEIIQKEFLIQDPDGYLLRFTD